VRWFTALLDYTLSGGLQGGDIARRQQNGGASPLGMLKHTIHFQVPVFLQRPVPIAHEYRRFNEI
jgi:hypothetical protein